MGLQSCKLIAFIKDHTFIIRILTQCILPLGMSKLHINHWIYHYLFGNNVHTRGVFGVRTWKEGADHVFIGSEIQKPLEDLINRSYIQKLWDPHLRGTFKIKLRHKFSISAVKAARIRYLSNIARWLLICWDWFDIFETPIEV